jgi:fatty-acyl-CoA synthase
VPHDQSQALPAYIVNHADDSYVLFDGTFASLVELLAPACPNVRGWIALADDAHMPAMSIPTLSYETLLAPHDGACDWPLLDERAASFLCYTSGTTGNPKGALYSHRSTVLHALGASLPGALGLSARDAVLPVVPMFHVNAWGIPHAAPLTGAKLVFPGKVEQRKLPEKQGHVIYGVDMKIVGEDGRELPWDGVSFGDLHVRGPWVIDRYFRSDASPLIDGWFPTGDVATIDYDGFMQITDRSKDLIKSGSEWISSIHLENIAIAHPAISEAACIACAHPKWRERPLLVFVKRPNLDITREELLAFYEGKVAKWWIPDDVAFIDELPHTATGKLHKLKLREQFRDHVLPSAPGVENCPLADTGAQNHPFRP